jgi:hypothetical protein
VDPIPDPPLLRKSGSAGNRTRDLGVSSQKLLTTRLQKSTLEVEERHLIPSAFSLSVLGSDSIKCSHANEELLKVSFSMRSVSYRRIIYGSVYFLSLRGFDLVNRFPR